MNESQDLFSLLRQSTDVNPQAIDAIKRTIAEGKDRELCRINAPAFASKHGLDEERAISAFLHAARLGIFDMFCAPAVAACSTPTPR